MERMGLFLAAILLAGCDSTLQLPLPASLDDPAMAAIGQNLDDDEAQLLQDYLLRREMATAFVGADFVDEAHTIGDALEAQRLWANNLSDSERKVEALKLEIERKRKAVSDQISRTVTVAFIEAKFHSNPVEAQFRPRALEVHYYPRSSQLVSYNDYASFTFAVKNSGTKAIATLKGQAVFADGVGAVLAQIPIKFGEPLKPGEKTIIQLGKELDRFMDEERQLMQLDNSKQFHFEPEYVIFQDGSSLRASRQE